MNKGRGDTSARGRRTDGTSTHHYVSRLRDVPGFARVYLAVGRVLEVPAVVRTYTRGEGELLPAGLEVVVATGDEPRNLTVEVRRGHPVEMVSALEDAANLLRSVLPLPGVEAHLQRQARPRAPPWTHSTGRLWAGALAAGVALLLWAAEAVTPRTAPEQVVDVPATAEGAALADARWSNDPEPMTVRRRLVMPDGPISGQDVPPCGKGYVPVNGGCWAKLEAKAPNCPERSVEYRGGCYLPVKGATPVPMSIDRRR